jgi:hypothetical protein
MGKPQVRVEVLKVSKLGQKTKSTLLPMETLLAEHLIKEALPQSVLTYSTHHPLDGPDVDTVRVTIYPYQKGGERGKSISFTVYGMKHQEVFDIVSKIKPEDEDEIHES